MAGHSKWANIKVRKGSQDAKRSVTFTRLSKSIMSAIREGGGTNISVNTKLKTAIEQAREANMPKENIERLLANFESKKNNLVPLLLEGFAPDGIPVLITCETDNKNRTLTEIKLIFRDAGAGLGDSGSVVFMFDHLGEIELEKTPSEDEVLEIIDMGAVDIVNSIVYTKPEMMHEIIRKMGEKNVAVLSSGLIYKPKSTVLEYDQKVLDFLESLEEQEDVINVFAGISG